MSNILELLCTEYENAYGLKMKKNFSIPKINHGGEDYDITKRWYVYYSYRHPETGKLVRQSPIYANFNRLHKTKRERLKHFKILRDTLEGLLKDGYGSVASIKSNKNNPLILGIMQPMIRMI